MKNLISFCKREAILCLAALAAVLSALWVYPSPEYIHYFDWRTLSQLFCLMLVVAGFQSLGIFSACIHRLLKHIRNTRQLAALLVLACFFTSMLITNDVALLTFVPFAILALRQTGQSRHMILVLIMQTLSANLGSMLTPLGNPQNLYLYGLAHLSLPAFLRIMAPTSGISLVLLILLLFCLPKQPLTENIALGASDSMPHNKTIAFSGLFLICLLCVLHILPYPVMLAIIIVSVFFLDRHLFRHVDYSLLATFAAFFIFVGNLKQMPAVSSLLQSFVTGREILVSVLSSQIISNVPSAVLLSGFTENYQDLLLGVNIGGLGTLIASMASLISFKFYCREKDSQKGRYLLWFTLLNLGFLAALLAATLLV